MGAMDSRTGSFDHQDLMSLRDWAKREVGRFCHRHGSEPLSSKGRDRCIASLVAVVTNQLAQSAPGTRFDNAIATVRRTSTRLVGAPPSFHTTTSPAAPPRVTPRSFNRFGEIALAALIAEGDPRAIAAFDRYRNSVERMIQSRFGVHAEKLRNFSDELLFRHDGRPSRFGSYQGRAPLLQWLQTVAERKLQDLLRADLRRRVHTTRKAVASILGERPPAPRINTRDEVTHPKGSTAPGPWSGVKPDEPLQRLLARRWDVDRSADPSAEVVRREFRRFLQRRIAEALAPVAAEDRLMLVLILVHWIPQNDAGTIAYGNRYQHVGSAVTRKKQAIGKALIEATIDLREPNPAEFDRISAGCLIEVLRRESLHMPMTQALADQTWRTRVAQALDQLTPSERKMLSETDLPRSVRFAFGGERWADRFEARTLRSVFSVVEKLRDWLDDDQLAQRFRDEPGPSGGYLWLADQIRNALGVG